MVDVKKIVSSDRGAIVMSILLGFGIATLFRKACLTRDCIVFEAPSKEMLTQGILKYDGKCYQNEPEHVQCDRKKKKVHFKKDWFW
jgi:hypothetical protein